VSVVAKDVPLVKDQQPPLVVVAANSTTNSSSNAAAAEPPLEFLSVSDSGFDSQVIGAAKPGYNSSDAFLAAAAADSAQRRCGPGYFDEWVSSTVTACALCPWGFYCVGNVSSAAGARSTAAPCPSGTANALMGGASEAEACVPCAAGTYGPSPGRLACLACAVGAYCAGERLTAGAACPAHTTASAGSRSLGDCACLPGFLCTYRREVRLRLRLNTTTTLQALQANAALAVALRNGVVAGLGLYGVAGITSTFEGFSVAAVAGA
jgi:hypothetical protein